MSTKSPTLNPTSAPTSIIHNTLHLGIIIIIYSFLAIFSISFCVIWKRGKYLRKHHQALKKKEKLCKEKLGLINGTVENVTGGMSHSAAVEWADYMMFHTSFGRFLDVAFIKLQQRIDQVMSYFLGGMLTQWMNFQVANSDLPAQTQNAALLIAFVLFILFSILNDQTTEFVVEHMGGDLSIAEPIKEDDDDSKD